MSGQAQEEIATLDPPEEATVTPPEQALGSYVDGQLINGTRLPDEAPGLLRLFLPRDRGWGSSELVQLLVTTARHLARRYPSGERLQVGDLSGRRGGRISGHGSHQNGLDADVAFLRRNGREQDPEAVSGFDESFVAGGRLSANFDLERNWALMRLLAASGRVNRIFVGPAINASLCAYARARGELVSEAETLRRLRPWPNHDDHLHLRIECPATSPRCVPQGEPPPGSGCPD